MPHLTVTVDEIRGQVVMLTDAGGVEYTLDLTDTDPAG